VERRADERAEDRRPGRQPGAPGAHLAQVEEPDEVAWHAPDRCGGCGGDLAGTPVAGVEARQVFDLPPLGLRVTEHRAERRRCACGTTTAVAFPDHVRAAACYGPGVRALVAYLCVHQHLPVDRAAQLLADVLGASVATGTLAAVVAEVAAGLGGFVEVVCEGLAGAPVAHFDETGARVAGRLDGHRDEVLRCLDDTRVPFDNNHAERDLRMVKLQQKISGCWRTPAGAEAFLALRSHVATARKHGRNPLAVLGQLFQGRPWLPAPAPGPLPASPGPGAA
jgi:transposase